MENEKIQTQSHLKISQEVVSTIVKNVIKENEGVHDLAIVPAKLAFMPSKNASMPVKVELDSDTAIITIALIMNMNYKIKDVCEQVQQDVKDAVQNMTGIAVSKVNIFVSGVNVPKH